METLYDLHWNVPTETKTHGDVCDYHVIVSRDYTKRFAEWCDEGNWIRSSETKSWVSNLYKYKEFKFATTEGLLQFFDTQNPK